MGVGICISFDVSTATIRQQLVNVCKHEKKEKILYRLNKSRAAQLFVF